MTPIDTTQKTTSFSSSSHFVSYGRMEFIVCLRIFYLFFRKSLKVIGSKPVVRMMVLAEHCFFRRMWIGYGVPHFCFFHFFLRGIVTHFLLPHLFGPHHVIHHDEPSCFVVGFFFFFGHDRTHGVFISYAWMSIGPSFLIALFLGIFICANSVCVTPSNSFSLSRRTCNSSISAKARSCLMYSPK